MKVGLFSLEDDNQASNKNDDISVLFQKSVFNGFSIGYSLEMKKYLTRHITEYSLIHTNSIWGYTHYLGYCLSKQFRIKRISTVHGMLAPKELNRGKLKKSLFRKFFVLKSLNSADCVHVTSYLEYNIVRAYGIKSPIAVIPIGMEMNFDQIQSEASFIHNQYPHLEGKRILLYLSRVHPIKSVGKLTEVWGRLYKNYPNWHLVIAGTGDDTYLGELKKQLHASGADTSTTFLGALYGDYKKELYKRCDLFVLPTQTENFGIVVLEALMFNKPVITTVGAPWKDLVDYHCGWWINHGVEPLYDCLNNALSLSVTDLLQIGANGKKLVEDHYAWPKVSEMMFQLYQWQLEGGKAPEFVHFN